MARSCFGAQCTRSATAPTCPMAPPTSSPAANSWHSALLRAISMRYAHALQPHATSRSMPAVSGLWRWQACLPCMAPAPTGAALPTMLQASFYTDMPWLELWQLAVQFTNQSYPEPR